MGRGGTERGRVTPEAVDVCSPPSCNGRCPPPAAERSRPAVTAAAEGELLARSRPSPGVREGRGFYLFGNAPLPPAVQIGGMAATARANR